MVTLCAMMSYAVPVMALGLNPSAAMGGPAVMSITICRWAGEAPRKRLHWATLWAIGAGVFFAMFQLVFTRLYGHH